MYESDMSLDEEEFIREHLSFLIECDGELSESSENSSTQFHSQDDSMNNAIYGKSPINSCVSETWSAASIGSITSPKETPSRPLSIYFNAHRPTTRSNANFAADNWQTPKFPLEDIFFGQNFSSPCSDLNRFADKHFELDMYKMWNAPQRNSYCQDNLFLGRPPCTARYCTSTNTCSNSSYRTWPYSDTFGQTPRVQEFPDYSKIVSRYQSLNLPHTSRQFPCEAEAVLNRYFNDILPTISEERRLLNELDLHRVFKDDLTTSRTSTPIDMYVKEKNQEIIAGHTVQREVLSPIRTQREVKMETEHSAIENENKENVSTKQSQKTRSNKVQSFCKFCYKNGELSDVYMSHTTKLDDGTIKCPILRKYVCDLCGATGDRAHTRKYCALNTEHARSKPVFRRLTNGVLTSSHNHK